MKSYQHNAGHMNKMAVMPIYGKITLKSSYHWALYISFILWHWVDLELFYGKVKVCQKIGKCDNDGFFGKYCIL